MSKEDVGGLSAAVDSYLDDQDLLHGIFVLSRNFPGRENFAGFTAHIHFVHGQHKRFEHLALVTDSPVAGMALKNGANTGAHQR